MSILQPPNYIDCYIRFINILSLFITIQSLFPVNSISVLLACGFLRMSNCPLFPSQTWTTTFVLDRSLDILNLSTSTCSFKFQHSLTSTIQHHLLYIYCISIYIKYLIAAVLNQCIVSLMTKLLSTSNDYYYYKNLYLLLLVNKTEINVMY